MYTWLSDYECKGTMYLTTLSGIKICAYSIPLHAGFDLPFDNAKIWRI